MSESDGFDFDVAVTFAGEDRSFVEEVVEAVKADGFSVFYDEDAKVEMWGEDLTEFFAAVYQRRSRYAVMFVSAAYAAKSWTRLERRSALVRAMEQNSAYLLPVRLDSTELPGLRTSVGYLDGLTEGAGGVAQAIAAKLQRPGGREVRAFNGRVPRTESEVALLMGERPPGWEYLLFSYWLFTKIDALRSHYGDHILKFALPDRFVTEDEILDVAQAELGRLTRLMTTAESLLLGRAQREAMGAPGEAGDPELIEHLADRLASIYAALLDWAYRLRGTSANSAEAADVLHVLADYANQPVDAIRQFVLDFRAEMDGLTGLLSSGEPLHLVWKLTIEVPDALSTEYDRVLKKFEQHRAG